MRPARMPRPWFVTIAAVLFVGAAGRLLWPTSGVGAAPAPDPLAYLPDRMVWAWERPEDLSGIDSVRAGVAFLARTLVLRGDEVLVRPRGNPLEIPPEAVRVAVTRIETVPAHPLTGSPAQLEAAVTAILPSASTPGLSALQIDFDATLSERPFYRALLSALRRRLPPGMGLSITALASWCLDDPWIDGLPIDEAVPMLFRMGREGTAIRRRIDGGADFRVPACRFSAGLSTDERAPALPPGRRIYRFHPRAWTEEALEQALREAP